MTTLNKQGFSERLPNKVEAKTAQQFEALIASKMRKDKSVSFELALNGGQTKDVVLSPALAAAVMEMLRLVSSGRGLR